MSTLKRKPYDTFMVVAASCGPLWDGSTDAQPVYNTRAYGLGCVHPVDNGD